MSRKSKLLLVVLLTLTTASLLAFFLMSGPSRATAPDDAIAAADAIVKELGGGEQPRDANGVPADAVIDPNNKPGKREISPPR